MHYFITSKIHYEVGGAMAPPYEPYLLVRSKTTIYRSDYCA